MPGPTPPPLTTQREVIPGAQRHVYESEFPQLDEVQLVGQVGVEDGHTSQVPGPTPPPLTTQREVIPGAQRHVYEL